MSTIEEIREIRAEIDLLDKDMIMSALDSKLDSVRNLIPDLIMRIAKKALYDLNSCNDEDQILFCIQNWAAETMKQDNDEIKYFMNGIGSLLIRAK